MFPPFVITVYESPNWAQCEKLDLKIIQSLLERVHICRRCWKTGAGGFFLTAQDQQGTREQLSQNIKTVVDHPENDTDY